MNLTQSLWSNGYFVLSFAVASISLLVASAWLIAKYRKQRKITGWIYLLASIVLHLGLIFWLPSLYQSAPRQEKESLEEFAQGDSKPVDFSTFVPDLNADSSSGMAQSSIAPLPLNHTVQTEVTSGETTGPNPNQSPDIDSSASFNPEMQAVETAATDEQPEEIQPTDLDENSEQTLADLPLDSIDKTAASLAITETETLPEMQSEFDSLLEDAFAGLDTVEPEDDSDSTPDSETQPAELAEADPPSMESDLAEQPTEPQADSPKVANVSPETNTTLEEDSSPEVASATPDSLVNPFTPQVDDRDKATVINQEVNDFANRQGAAKTRALHGTGGNEDTEAAVQRALEYLVQQQREDGAWDPRTSNAGLERSPLGTSRGSAGSQAETALTGLALLSLMGAGHTHQNGEYSDAVYRGLAFLIHQQKPNGSMKGRANIYEATYCHGIAALAMCEAAAITGDPSAILSAQRAITHTQQLQHSQTGGWRYSEGDPGDLSQLGWQAMVLDSGHRAGIQISSAATAGVQRFLRSVQNGTSGGLASYRSGEAVSRTMTAEAMATRLLIGDSITQSAIEEGELYLMQQLPGTGQDNYYYWYYATIALHQLQNQNWNRWNQALQNRLINSQNPDGSWPTDTLWGGYGGRIYTTAMATLCLETYYRHTIRNNKTRIAQLPNQPLRR